MKVIPYGRQEILEEDIDSVNNVLRADYLTQGPLIDQFEKDFADYVGANFAVTVSNGTAALHLSVLSLNLQPGDKVITTPITFAASANCIEYCGAEVVFCDIDPNTYLIDVNKVERILQDDTNRSIKGIIPVNFAGRVCDIEKLRSVTEKYKIWIVEDACHSPGGYFIDSKNERQLSGNGKYSNTTVFSFHPVKHIATGEGGMITTNDEQLYNSLIELRTHGITREKSKFKNLPSLAAGVDNVSDFPLWYMEMQNLGFNYRITDIQAALGVSQLKRAGKGLDRRRELAANYFEKFRNCDSVIGQSGVIDGHAYHLYVIEVEDRLGLFNFLREHGIYAQIHYFPCHLMPFYREKRNQIGDCPNAEAYYKNCISLPMFPTLSDEDQLFVIEKVLNFLK